MKILLVSSYLPFPLFDGGTIRLYNLIKLLKKDHEVTIVCEKRLRQTVSDVKEVEKICHKVIVIPRKKQWSLQNIVKTGISKNSFLITGHTLPQMKEAIDHELKSTNFDLIHIETFYVSQNLPPTDLPVVLVEHNIEYLVYQKFMKRAPILLRPFLKIDIQKLKNLEERAWQQATQVVTVSDLERKVVEKSGVNAKTVYNGVDLQAFPFKDLVKAAETPIKQFLFIGSYKWLQNRDSARFVLQEIWPKIKMQAKEKVVLRIVGRDMPTDIKNWQDESVIIEENSSRKTAEIFSKSFVLLAPIRIGGGSQYKILESMAVGTPTITTPLGLSGLDVREGRDILVGNSASELAKESLKLLDDPKLYKELAHNGRAQIEKKYDWTAIAKNLEDVYKSVVKETI